MNENEMVYWVLFTLTPVLIAGGTMWMKFNHSKQRQENRITRIESDAEDLKGDVKELKQDRDFIRDESKILAEVKGQNTIIIQNMDDLKKDIRALKGG